MICVFKWGRGHGGVRYSNMCAQFYADWDIERKCAWMRAHRFIHLDIFVRTTFSGFERTPCLSRKSTRVFIHEAPGVCLQLILHTNGHNSLLFCAHSWLSVEGPLWFTSFEKAWKKLLFSQQPRKPLEHFFKLDTHDSLDSRLKSQKSWSWKDLMFILLMWRRYLRNAWREYLQIWYKCPLELKDEPLKFRWSKVKWRLKVVTIKLQNKCNCNPL